MKTSLILPGFLVLALVGCKANPNPAPVATQPAEPSESQPAPARHPHGPPEPKFGWKEFHAETFETNPLHANQSERQFLIPGKASRLRVKVNASSEILGGVVSNDLLLALRLPHKAHRIGDFHTMPCSLQSVEKASVTCDIDASKKMAFLVRDGRAEGTKPAGILGIKSKSRKAAEQATLPDKIFISLATWQCIENCSKP